VLGGRYHGRAMKLASVPFLISSLSAALCVASCSRDQQSTEEIAPPRVLKLESEERSGPGPLAGRVTFVGTPRKEVSGVPGTDPCDGEGTPQSPVVEGGLANVVVWLEGSPVSSSPPPSIEVSAEKCRFVPPVSVAQVGARLHADNKDARLHSFHLRSDDGQGGRRNLQNLVVPPGEPPASWLLDTPGRVHIGSDARAGMEAWIFVYERGLATVTDDDGRFELVGISAGNWRVRFWHPEYGEVVRPVQVPVDGPASLYVSLPAS
jgi:hypothetical protein